MKKPSSKEVIDYMKNLTKKDLNCLEGTCWGLVYRYGPEIDELIQEVSSIYKNKNAANVAFFPSVSLIEQELIEICNHLMSGESTQVGCVTGGGTESNFLVLRAYRNRAWQEKGRQVNQILLPDSAHPSVYKAAYDLNLSVIEFPVSNFEVKAFEKLLNDKILAVVLSAPAYINGKIDPIEEISNITVNWGIPLHIDASLGGMFLPFMDALGYPVKPYNFKLPGVQSISIDLHKYGFAPRAVSVVLYRDKLDRHYQYFVKTFKGYTYAAPVFQGSRSAVASACALAIYKYLGLEGFKKGVERTLRVCNKIKKFVEAQASLDLLSEFDSSILCITSRKKNLANLARYLLHKQWVISYFAEINTIHLIVMPVHDESLERFLADFNQGLLAVTEDLKDRTFASYVYGLDHTQEDAYQLLDNRYDRKK